ncbi:hypothetical protein H5S09_00370 [Limosilactobacillus sp. STM2_1]|uniref:Uncharacterized protein n=1 Tax=Limosilactobacillus rudii TaxID=2759755 RepID=A0A7W3YMF9_9LACO|nr:hypothetical protein [Limosilactobacillus rudii]MBB1080076.1 hypothetical protein [Limosilactobacillus rudii]MBB1096436.1 hypothetical protein [Limosilactobacillus rudii]MCD7133563.1 hypothetical protein [Limosilactobacillus rudii]
MQRLKEIKSDFQHLSSNVAQLKRGINELQDSLPAVTNFVKEIERDIKKWQFKTQPRLNRIQIILDVLKIDQKEK